MPSTIVPSKPTQEEEEARKLKELRARKDAEIRARRDKNNQALRAAMSEKERLKDDAITKKNAADDYSVSAERRKEDAKRAELKTTHNERQALNASAGITDPLSGIEKRNRNKDAIDDLGSVADKTIDTVQGAVQNATSSLINTIASKIDSPNKANQLGASILRDAATSVMERSYANQAAAATEESKMSDAAVEQDRQFGLIAPIGEASATRTPTRDVFGGLFDTAMGVTSFDPKETEEGVSRLVRGSMDLAKAFGDITPEEAKAEAVATWESLKFARDNPEWLMREVVGEGIEESPAVVTGLLSRRFPGLKKLVGPMSTILESTNDAGQVMVQVHNLVKAETGDDEEARKVSMAAGAASLAMNSMLGGSGAKMPGAAAAGAKLDAFDFGKGVVSGAVTEGLDSVIENIALNQPLQKGVGQSAALGAILDPALAVALPAVEKTVGAIAGAAESVAKYSLTTGAPVNPILQSDLATAAAAGMDVKDAEDLVVKAPTGVNTLQHNPKSLPVLNERQLNFVKEFYPKLVDPATGMLRPESSALFATPVGKNILQKIEGMSMPSDKPLMSNLRGDQQQPSLGPVITASSHPKTTAAVTGGLKAIHDSKSMSVSDKIALDQDPVVNAVRSATNVFEESSASAIEQVESVGTDAVSKQKLARASIGMTQARANKAADAYERTGNPEHLTELLIANNNIKALENKFNVTNRAPTALSVSALDRRTKAAKRLRDFKTSKLPRSVTGGGITPNTTDGESIIPRTSRVKSISTKDIKLNDELTLQKARDRDEASLQAKRDRQAAENKKFAVAKAALDKEAEEKRNAPKEEVAPVTPEQVKEIELRELREKELADAKSKQPEAPVKIISDTEGTTATKNYNKVERAAKERFGDKMYTVIRKVEELTGSSLASGALEDLLVKAVVWKDWTSKERRDFTQKSGGVPHGTISSVRNKYRPGVPITIQISVSDALNVTETALHELTHAATMDSGLTSVVDTATARSIEAFMRHMKGTPLREQIEAAVLAQVGSVFSDAWLPEYYAYTVGMLTSYQTTDPVESALIADVFENLVLDAHAAMFPGGSDTLNSANKVVRESKKIAGNVYTRGKALGQTFKEAVAEALKAVTDSAGSRRVEDVGSTLGLTGEAVAAMENLYSVLKRNSQESMDKQNQESKQAMLDAVLKVGTARKYSTGLTKSRVSDSEMHILASLAVFDEPFEIAPADTIGYSTKKKTSSVATTSRTVADRKLESPLDVKNRANKELARSILSRMGVASSYHADYMKELRDLIINSEVQVESTPVAKSVDDIIMNTMIDISEAFGVTLMSKQNALSINSALNKIIDDPDYSSVRPQLAFLSYLTNLTIQGKTDISKAQRAANKKSRFVVVAGETVPATREARLAAMRIAQQTAANEGTPLTQELVNDVLRQAKTKPIKDALNEYLDTVRKNSIPTTTPTREPQYLVILDFETSTKNTKLGNWSLDATSAMRDYLKQEDVVIVSFKVVLLSDPVNPDGTWKFSKSRTVTDRADNPEIVQLLEDYSRNDFLVAHNANFERAVLDTKFTDIQTDRGIVPNYNIIDTAEMAKELVPGVSASLRQASNTFGLSIEKGDISPFLGMTKAEMLHPDNYDNLVEYASIDTDIGAELLLQMLPYITAVNDMSKTLNTSTTSTVLREQGTALRGVLGGITMSQYGIQTGQQASWNHSIDLQVNTLLDRVIDESKITSTPKELLYNYRRANLLLDDGELSVTAYNDHSVVWDKSSATAFLKALRNSMSSEDYSKFEHLAQVQDTLRFLDVTTDIDKDLSGNASAVYDQLSSRSSSGISLLRAGATMTDIVIPDATIVGIPNSKFNSGVTILSPNFKPLPIAIHNINSSVFRTYTFEDTKTSNLGYIAPVVAKGVNRFFGNLFENEGYLKLVQIPLTSTPAISSIKSIGAAAYLKDIGAQADSTAQNSAADMLYKFVRQAIDDVKYRSVYSPTFVKDFTIPGAGIITFGEYALAMLLTVNPDMTMDQLQALKDFIKLPENVDAFGGNTPVTGIKPDPMDSHAMYMYGNEIEVPDAVVNAMASMAGRVVGQSFLNTLDSNTSPSSTIVNGVKVKTEKVLGFDTDITIRLPSGAVLHITLGSVATSLRKEADNLGAVGTLLTPEAARAMAKEQNELRVGSFNGLNYKLSFGLLNAITLKNLANSSLDTSEEGSLKLLSKLNVGMYSSTADQKEVASKTIIDELVSKTQDIYTRLPDMDPVEKASIVELINPDGKPILVSSADIITLGKTELAEAAVAAIESDDSEDDKLSEDELYEESFQNSSYDNFYGDSDGGYAETQNDMVRNVPNTQSKKKAFTTGLEMLFEAGYTQQGPVTGTSVNLNTVTTKGVVSTAKVVMKDKKGRAAKINAKVLARLIEDINSRIFDTMSLSVKRSMARANKGFIPVKFMTNSLSGVTGIEHNKEYTEELNQLFLEYGIHFTGNIVDSLTAAYSVVDRADTIDESFALSSDKAIKDYVLGLFQEASVINGFITESDVKGMAANRDYMDNQKKLTNKDPEVRKSAIKTARSMDGAVAIGESFMDNYASENKAVSHRSAAVAALYSGLGLNNGEVLRDAWGNTEDKQLGNQFYQEYYKEARNIESAFDRVNAKSRLSLTQSYVDEATAFSNQVTAAVKSYQTNVDLNQRDRQTVALLLAAGILRSKRIVNPTALENFKKQRALVIYDADEATKAYYKSGERGEYSTEYGLTVYDANELKSIYRSVSTGLVNKIAESSAEDGQFPLLSAGTLMYALLTRSDIGDNLTVAERLTLRNDLLAQQLGKSNLTAKQLEAYRAGLDAIEIVDGKVMVPKGSMTPARARQLGAILNEASSRGLRTVSGGLSILNATSMQVIRDTGTQAQIDALDAVLAAKASTASERSKNIKEAALELSYNSSEPHVVRLADKYFGGVIPMLQALKDSSNSQIWYTLKIPQAIRYVENNSQGISTGGDSLTNSVTTLFHMPPATNTTNELANAVIEPFTGFLLNAPFGRKSSKKFTDALEKANMPVVEVMRPVTVALTSLNRVLSYRHNIKDSLENVKAIKHAIKYAASLELGAVDEWELHNLRTSLQMAFPHLETNDDMANAIAAYGVSIHRAIVEMSNRTNIVSEATGDINSLSDNYFKQLKNALLSVVKPMEDDAAHALSIDTSVAAAWKLAVRNITKALDNGEVPVGYNETSVHLIEMAMDIFNSYAVGDTTSAFVTSNAFAELRAVLDNLKGTTSPTTGTLLHAIQPGVDGLGQYTRGKFATALAAVSNRTDLSPEESDIIATLQHAIGSDISPVHIANSVVGAFSTNLDKQNRLYAARKAGQLLTQAEYDALPVGRDKGNYLSVSMLGEATDMYYHSKYKHIIYPAKDDKVSLRAALTDYNTIAASSVIRGIRSLTGLGVMLGLFVGSPVIMAMQGITSAATMLAVLGMTYGKVNYHNAVSTVWDYTTKGRNNEATKGFKSDAEAGLYKSGILEMSAIFDTKRLTNNRSNRKLVEGLLFNEDGTVSKLASKLRTINARGALNNSVEALSTLAAYISILEMSARASMFMASYDRYAVTNPDLTPDELTVMAKDDVYSLFPSPISTPAGVVASIPLMYLNYLLKSAINIVTYPIVRLYEAYRGVTGKQRLHAFWKAAVLVSFLTVGSPIVKEAVDTMLTASTDHSLNSINSLLDLTDSPSRIGAIVKDGGETKYIFTNVDSANQTFSSQMTVSRLYNSILGSNPEPISTVLNEYSVSLLGSIIPIHAPSKAFRLPFNLANMESTTLSGISGGKPMSLESVTYSFERGVGQQVLNVHGIMADIKYDRFQLMAEKNMGATFLQQEYTKDNMLDIDKYTISKDKLHVGDVLGYAEENIDNLMSTSKVQKTGVPTDKDIDVNRIVKELSSQPSAQALATSYVKAQKLRAAAQKVMDDPKVSKEAKEMAKAIRDTFYMPGVPKFDKIASTSLVNNPFVKEHNTADRAAINYITSNLMANIYTNGKVGYSPSSVKSPVDIINNESFSTSYKYDAQGNVIDKESKYTTSASNFSGYFDVAMSIDSLIQPSHEAMEAITLTDIGGGKKAAFTDLDTVQVYKIAGKTDKTTGEKTYSEKTVGYRFGDIEAPEIPQTGFTLTDKQRAQRDRLNRAYPDVEVIGIVTSVLQFSPMFPKDFGVRGSMSRMGAFSRPVATGGFILRYPNGSTRVVPAREIAEKAGIDIVRTIEPEGTQNYFNAARK